MKRLFLRSAQTLKECTLHNTRQMPNIKATEKCLGCNQEMCYLCSNKHIDKGHPVLVDQCIEKNLQYAMDMNPVLKTFNNGSLVGFDLSGSECACGSKIANHEHGGICVACGSATCSTECHVRFAEQTNQCTFHEQFSSKQENVSMRSIVVKNIRYLQKQGYGRGTPVNKTSQHFIIGFLSGREDHIYLQRGYRMYGNPSEQTLQAMYTVQEGALDKEVNLYRICHCKCSNCRDRGLHPMINCQDICKDITMINIRSLDQEYQARLSCSCQCEFCMSGVTCFSHKLIDCAKHCERSPINKK